MHPFELTIITLWIAGVCAASAAVLSVVGASSMLLGAQSPLEIEFFPMFAPTYMGYAIFIGWGLYRWWTPATKRVA